MSTPEGIGSLVIVGFLIQYLRKFLDTKNRVPQWDKLLGLFWPFVGILYGIGALLHIRDITAWWFWGGAGAFLCYVVWQMRDFRPARPVLTALAPFFGILFLNSLIAAIAPKFHKVNNDYFESAITFTYLWLFAFIYVANRQKKAEEQLQLERQQEAEARQVIEARRSELEVLVAERTAEITRQKEDLEKALADLKATQTQLIQSEKMASLGELTAGIAHEIQNPLNFVNNFSEVSAELIDELEEERKQSNRDPDLEAEILADLKQNLEKITHHGGRAASIVRGMLQHSRTSSGQREPTDLNGLTDEYLRLAYHGLRAKDKSFNATLVSELDPSLKPIPLLAQDMGRVLLNLFTNAFYAVHQRQKQNPSADFKPTVTVRTQSIGNQVQITVSDNGTGIPEDVKAKIFQPFFTTKPTGEGTGLGLSLAYDIVTKGHNGTLTVDSQEGQGTTFFITLPLY
ncbi:ATP-binding protein [Spirosoma sp. KUDC1026]|uniref:ATP-binding protein n=1 Tax=Spirosoma sp. KUDC1026 TaxID=2745947 RepID=UPI00159BD0FC|nr:ATP-binding protein [Spirosoma sp. KUDC1026]QKZ15455.1 histidine kinase [Spirosoma sp. KUDC1026]